jgi:hypothetical protein
VKSRRRNRDLAHLRERFASILLLKRMKRLLQFVAAFVVASLTAQPALAGIRCGLRALNPPCALACPMAHHMGAECPIPHRGAGSGCAQDCCPFGPQQAISRSVIGTKPKASTPLAFLAALPQIPIAGGTVFTRAPIELAASPPPRYILFRVIRI